MPKYKVWVQVEQDPQRGYIVLEADSEKEAKERAEEAFEEDYDAFTWDAPDLSKTDFAEALSAEVID